MQLCSLVGAATASAEQLVVQVHAHRHSLLSQAVSVAEELDAHKRPRGGLLPGAAIPTQLDLLSPCYPRMCSKQTHPSHLEQSAAHTAILRLRLVLQAVAPTDSTQ